MKIKIFTKRLIAVVLGILLNTAAIGNEETKYDVIYKNDIFISIINFQRGIIQ